MPNPSRMLVIGLPAAGKTTFVAALWHVVSTEEVDGSLVLDELQPDRTHLNGIAKLWRECKKIPRTSIPKERTVTMNVKNLGTGIVHQISLPDASGEAFRRIFEKRRWSPEIADLAKRADTLLFFLHPSSLAGARRIDDNMEDMVETASVEKPVPGVGDVNGRVEEIGVGVEKALATSGEAKIKARPFEPGLSSPQGKLVDLLQVVHSARDAKGLKTAIIISAWDLVKAEKLSPSKWIEKRVPLLKQYLDSYRIKFPYEVFGVSAQGDDLKACESLREFVQPADRIEVVWGTESSHDITLPIRWALE